MIKIEILVLDIETTGLKYLRDEIVEIGIVKLDTETGKTIDIFSETIRPIRLSGTSPHCWVFEHTDLTLNIIKQSKLLMHYKYTLQKLFSLYPCACYNVSFDFAFLKHAGFKFKFILDDPMLILTNIIKLPGFYGKYKWPKFQEAWEYYFPNVEYVECHRALDDARHEAVLINHLIKINLLKLPQG